MHYDRYLYELFVDSIEVGYSGIMYILVKPTKHNYSMGNGAAIKSGARLAHGDIIVFMDADGQHDPYDIPHMAKLHQIHLQLFLLFLYS